VLGVTIVLTMPQGGGDPPAWLAKSFFTSVFVILTSFALSIAGKYLDGKK